MLHPVLWRLVACPAARWKHVARTPQAPQRMSASETSWSNALCWRGFGVIALALVLSCIAQGAAISLNNTQALAFGAFVAGNGGSVVIAPSGARSAGGGVVLVSSNAGAAAQFSVSGDPNFTYAITLPADGTVALSDGAGHSMNASNFTSSPSLTGQLSGAGNQQLSVGATLNVGNNQPTGAYSGSFIVTVDYN